MRLIFLRPSNKFTINWLKRNNIKLHIVEQILTTIVSKEKKSRKDYMYDIDIRIDEHYTSGYYFGINEVNISSQACLYEDREKKLKSFLANLLHEFRHWIQDKLLGISPEDLDYTTDDVKNSTSKYWNNVHEIDARDFEVKYMQKCYDLYIAFDKI